ncbi:MAG TPA: tetratricopeptide repeat protein [Candidatus Competibacter sp.]|nr:tetratricopeptide repeat protein [Candidatus Competibacter sp.]HRX62674.1 tetratricopeptide repeat protein [Candidatus Competibacter sp.]
MKILKILKIGALVVGALKLGVAAIPIWAEEPVSPTPSAQEETATDLESLYHQALQAYQKDDYDGAIAILTQILERDSRQTKAYLARAKLYGQQNRSDLVRADYRQVIALDPQNVSAYGNLGWQLILDGRFEEAHDVTEKAHTLAPAVFVWLVNLGHLALLAGDRKQAQAYYRQGLERIQSNEQFEQGPVADLKLFIQNGWAVEAAQQELIWLRKTFAPRQRWLTLNQQTVQAYQAGDYSTAEKAARTALEVAETAFGPGHSDTAISLDNLAVLYRTQSRYAEAELLNQRALAIQEKVLSPDHPDIARSLNNLARLYHTQGYYVKAEPLYQQSLAILEKALGPDHPDVARSLNSLAVLYYTQGRYVEAEPLYQRALAIREKIFDSDDLDVAESLNNLAVLYRAQGRYAEAELFDQRALAIWEKALGPNHLNVAESLNKLAEFYRAQGQSAEAEPLYQRSRVIREKNLGSDHPDVAESLNGLAALYHAQGRYGKAEPLYQRARAIRKKALGPDHPDVATSLNNLAGLYHAQGQYGKAAPLYQRALAILEKALGPDHPDVAQSLNGLAALYHAQGRYGKAEPLYQRARAIWEQAFGPDHPDVAQSLNNLALLYVAQGQSGKAAPLYRRAVAIAQHIGISAGLLLYSRNQGRFLVERGQLYEALPYYRIAADTLDRLFNQTRGLPEEARLTFLGQYAYVYREFLELLLTLHEQDTHAGYDREFLAVASRNQSRIFSELLRQGDVNRLADDPAFMALKDQRQDRLNQRAGLREKRATMPITAPNAEGQKADLQTRMAALTAELTPIEARLWRDYPRFMELLDVPRPVTVAQLQQTLLQPGEALLSLVLLPQRTVLLAVTRERFVLQVAPLTRDAVTAHVHAIRQGLIGDLSQLEHLDPHDLYALYQGLIAPVEPVLNDAQRLLVVADGPLYSLPLELLITAHDATQQRAFRHARRRADGSANHPWLRQYADLPYLAERYTFRYLPSLAALAAQRRYPKPPVPVTRPLVAFADPIFSPTEDTASPTTTTSNYPPATQHTLARLKRSGSLTAPLKRLPETAEEAQAIAAAVPGDAHLYLRQDAQEHTVKTLSQSGALHGLRYLLFATHGLLGGEYRRPEPEPEPRALREADRHPRPAPRNPLGQPALALTLVGDLHHEDGFLTLKDVIEDLDLNTDLAILSACNTAGDRAQTATGEGFAGLTRAFLFAGARHLWVSHWPVESAAARDLTTTAIQVLEAGATDPALALAQAQQTLRTSVIETPNASGSSSHLARAHPFFWAPFVTVGD